MFKLNNSIFILSKDINLLNIQLFLIINIKNKNYFLYNYTNLFIFYNKKFIR